MDLENTIGNNGFEFPASNSDFPFNAVGASSTGIILNEHQTEKLQIIAQPKASYRGRYTTEIDEKKHRAKRFIRAENKRDKHGYPTIKVIIFHTKKIKQKKDSNKRDAENTKQYNFTFDI